MADTYRLPDEPGPSSLSQYAVAPFWPLLSVMVAGAWLAWPWFVFNAHALGSPTARRETAVAIGGFVATAALGLLAILAFQRGWLESDLAERLCIVGIISFKLVVSYYLCTLQARTYAVFEHYEGVGRSGERVVVAGFFLHSLVLGLSGSALWRIIVSSWGGSIL
jgi:hypothetical protein